MMYTDPMEKSFGGYSYKTFDVRYMGPPRFDRSMIVRHISQIIDQPHKMKPDSEYILFSMTFNIDENIVIEHWAQYHEWNIAHKLGIKKMNRQMQLLF